MKKQEISRGAIDGAPKFPIKHRLLRLFWRLIWYFFASWTPASFRGWRVFLLRLFGAKIGTNSDVRNSARIWYPPNFSLGSNSLVGPRCDIYCMNIISIGDNCIISQGSFLCGGTHDIDSRQFELVTRPVIVGDFCWVAADAFLGPGVTMQQGSVLGARSAAFRDLDPWSVYIGSPAIKIKNRKNFTVDMSTGGN